MVSHVSPSPRRLIPWTSVFYSISLLAVLSFLTIPSVAKGAAEQPESDSLVRIEIADISAIDVTTVLDARKTKQEAKLEFKTPPPLPIFGDVLAQVSQSNFLAVSIDHSGKASFFSYNNVTEVWTVIGSAQLASIPAQLIPTDNGFIAGNADGSFQQISLVTAKQLMSMLDWVVIGLYFVAMAGIGWWCYRRENKRNTDGFFLAGRNVPWWAAGISLYATGTSALSFMAVPAKSFATNWLYGCQVFIGLFGLLFVAYKVIPLIRRLGMTSVYQYLELRFHPSIRVFSSAICIVSQLAGRLSIVLFLPSLAISGVTGFDVTTSVILMGVITTIYTVLGGMKAVIWTDVIQVIVMMGGAFLILAFGIYGLKGGLPEFMRITDEYNKMHTFDFRFDLLQPTVWAFLIVEFTNVLTWPKDQVMMQRVLATKDDKEATRSVLGLALMILPGTLLFFSLGTALFAFYHGNPERMNPLLNNDSIIPLFVAAELPAGITGLIIAGLFAASMSTLSGGINSVATLISVDFYERFSKKATQAKSVRLAEWSTVIAGIICTGFAVLLSFIKIDSLWDVSMKLAAILGGGFAGAYGLGMFTKRANWQGALCGTVMSIGCAAVLTYIPNVSAAIFLGASVTACLVFGYIGSFFFPPPKHDLAGLTVFTPKKNEAA